jgi:hypothetical protein
MSVVLQRVNWKLFCIGLSAVLLYWLGGISKTIKILKIGGAITNIRTGAVLPACSTCYSATISTFVFLLVHTIRPGLCGISNQLSVIWTVLEQEIGRPIVYFIYIYIFFSGK